MVQADAFGIPVGQVLRVQSSEIRVKKRQWAEEQAQKVPVKILVPLIFCILPCLFIAVLGPAAISIMDNFTRQAPMTDVRRVAIAARVFTLAVIVSTSVVGGIGSARASGSVLVIALRRRSLVSLSRRVPEGLVAVDRGRR